VFTRVRVHMVLAGIVGCAVCLAALTLNWPWAFRSGGLRDFGSFVASGKAANAGLNPYSADAPGVFVSRFPALGMAVASPNLNPPLSIPVFSWLATRDAPSSLLIWRILTGALYLVCLSLLIRTCPQPVMPLRVLWAFSLAGFWHILELGQIYAPLLLASTIAWLILPRRKELLAGILIGLLIAFKPQFGIWALFLLVAGHRAAALASLLSAALLTLLPLPFYGPAIYQQWLTASAQFSGVALPNGSLPGITIRFGAAWPGYLIAAIIFVVLLLRLRARPQPLWRTNACAIAVGLLASPVAWPGYTLFLLPAFFQRERWSVPMGVAAAMLVLPFPVVMVLFMQSPLGFVVFGSWYAWALLLVLLAVFPSPLLPKRATSL
jgi:alpha-1,2-mannosyltransferase